MQLLEQVMRTREPKPPSARQTIRGKKTARPSGPVAKLSRVKFGSVVMKVQPPDPAEVRQSIKAGQIALKRAMAKIASPGVRIAKEKGVPLFYANSKGELIRALNGGVKKGAFVNGKFKVNK